ncbi:MAG: transcriptional repressor [Clostridia bacterium]|nr:transcriptional repressor [Clostridia bacterium]
MRNYSKQREAILKVLRNSKSHPTASQVYEEVRKEIPNISLGTVYRNLAILVEDGEIISVVVGDGNDHFDGDNSFHLHLHCKKCGSITDVPVDDKTIEVMSGEEGFCIENAVCVVYGICRNCKEQ